MDTHKDTHHPAVAQSLTLGREGGVTSICLCARTASLKGNYLVKTLGPVTACLPLIKDSSHGWVLFCYTYDIKQPATELNINTSRRVQGSEFTTVPSNMESSHIKKPKCLSHIELEREAFYNNENLKHLTVALTNDRGSLFVESFSDPFCL